MVDYDRSTALVVVDVQNDFADPKGSLYVGEGERVVPLVNRELQGALAADALVAYTQDWHPAQTPLFQSGGGVWPEHCVQYTWCAQLHPDLQVAGEVIRKGQGGEDGYSGFTVRDPVTGQEAATPLEGLLRRRGIGRVVVVGLATDYCVKETALDAVRLGFDTVVLGGLVRAVDLEPGDGQRALAAMRGRGAHRAAGVAHGGLGVTRPGWVGGVRRRSTPGFVWLGWAGRLGRGGGHGPVRGLGCLPGPVPHVASDPRRPSGPGPATAAIRHPPHAASTPRPTTAATAAARTRSRLLPGRACVCEHAPARR